MLIAEDLVLLVFDDETGKPDSMVTNLPYALAGALLIELGIENRIGVDGKGRLELLDRTPPAHPVLADALVKLEKFDGRKPKDAISPLSGQKLTERLLEGLADRGVLRREEGKVLKLFPVTRWPAEDSAHEESLRSKLNAVLVDGEEPDERTAALVAVLAAIKAASKVLDLPERADRKVVDQRAKEIAEGDWGSTATRKAIDELMVAVMTAVMIPAIVTTTAT
ncbi:GPP34 family phosphoprotein [Amycolatopsis sp. 195334CR]|uniref:GOLPH3/VPS74 family protein n=1 Tax=Amycolatopsis sp. 195334CR TaxID=2814588 RepID=UPI001A90402F|nr:GPP34 family phosphoprotein [Amycolatopsis sp. 195334CR]MBN6037398.1 GPP34 family phosphoprotein [Amycolatopsis sp. 195334CR]